MTRHARSVTAAVVLIVGATPALFGQSEKINLRIAPRPEQTVRTTMTQEMDFDMSMDSTAGAPPIKMLMRSTIGMTQKTGPLKPDGTLDAEVTYEQISAELSMNGQVTPGTNAADVLVGKTIIVTYSGNGDIVDVKGLPATGVTGDVVKQIMTSLRGSMPAMTLAVGESTTTPLDVALPLPIPGAAGLKMMGETTLKLVSIDTNPEGRSARLASTTHSKVATSVASPDGQNTMILDMITDGEGTSVIDLDTGVLRSSVMSTTMSGKIDTAGAAPTPSMTMRGMTTVTITSMRLSAGK